MPASNPMKVKCEHCGTRYVMDEERVRGRVLRIRCKACHEVFEVRGHNEPSLVSRGKRWFLALGKQRVGPVTTQEVRDRFERGEIKPTTYVWRQGFSRWERLKAVVEFADLLAISEAVAEPPGESAGDAAATAPARAAQVGGAAAGDGERSSSQPLERTATDQDSLGAQEIDREWPDADTAVVSYQPGEDSGEVKAEYVFRPEFGQPEAEADRADGGGLGSAADDAQIASRRTVLGVGPPGMDALLDAPRGASDSAVDRPVRDDAQEAREDGRGTLQAIDTLPSERVVRLAAAFGVPGEQEASAGEGDGAADASEAHSGARAIAPSAESEVATENAALADTVDEARRQEPAKRMDSLFDDAEPGGASDERVITYPAQLKGQRSESSVLFSLPHLLQAAAKPRVDRVQPAPARKPTGERFVIIPQKQADRPGAKEGEPLPGGEDITLDVRPVEGPSMPRVPLPDPSTVPSRGRRSAGQLVLVAVLGVGLGAGVLFGVVYLVNPGLVRSLFGSSSAYLPTDQDGEEPVSPKRAADRGSPAAGAPKDLRATAPDRAGLLVAKDAGLRDDRAQAATPAPLPRPAEADAGQLQGDRGAAEVPSAPAKIVRRRPPRRPLRKPHLRPTKPDSTATSSGRLDAGTGTRPKRIERGGDARPAVDRGAPAGRRGRTAPGPKPATPGKGADKGGKPEAPTEVP